MVLQCYGVFLFYYQHSYETAIKGIKMIQAFHKFENGNYMKSWYMNQLYFSLQNLVCLTLQR